MALREWEFTMLNARYEIFTHQASQLRYSAPNKTAGLRYVCQMDTIG